MQFEILAETLTRIEGPADQFLQFAQPRIQLRDTTARDLAFALAEQELGGGIDQENARLRVYRDDRGRQVLEQSVRV